VPRAQRTGKPPVSSLLQNSFRIEVSKVKKSPVSLLAALSLVFVLTTHTFVEAQTPRGETLALTNATVIDGEGGRARVGMTILIAGDRIVKVAESVKTKLPPGARVINLAGRYVIPGLIDSHYHFMLGTRPAEVEVVRRRFALLGGVTTVRDMAGDAVALGELARVANTDGNAESPRVYFAALLGGPTLLEGDARVAPISHGRKNGEAPWARSIRPDANIPQVITEAKAAGVTAIKIYADLPAETVARLTKEAHRQGLRVWSHFAIFPAKPSEVVSAGVDVVSHAVDLIWETQKTYARFGEVRYGNVDWKQVSVDDPAIMRVLKLMRARGTMLDATVLVTHDRIVGRQLRRAASERTIAEPERLDRWLFAVVRRAREMGIPITVGTDIPEWETGHELPNIHDELELLVTRAGLTPLEAITAATLGGARSIGVENSLGTIRAGKLADLVILTADPTADIRNTRQIEYVIKGGVVHKRELVKLPTQ
jgi:imidazolonepropionase-like amidohydrolase